jgi:hypothetical protein
MAEEKRAKVNVYNGAARSLMLHLHMVVPDDGGGRAFQGRLRSASSKDMPDAVELRAGHNPGIDKAFFAMWVGQNKQLAENLGITAEDEESPPETEGN